MKNNLSFLVHKVAADDDDDDDERQCVGFSPFSSRYPQPVTAMVDPAERSKALGGRQTGLRLTERQGHSFRKC